MAKTIVGSVGMGGLNGTKDTMTIQYLLNCVPKTKGGPTIELVVDGIVGPKTIAAIKAFQKVHSPVADGRVDPGKATLAKLQAYDPSGSTPINLGGPKLSASPDAKGGIGVKDASGKAGAKEAAGSKTAAGAKDGGFGQKDPGSKWAGGGQKSPGGKDGGFGYKDAGGKGGGFGWKDAGSKWPS